MTKRSLIIGLISATAAALFLAFAAWPLADRIVRAVLIANPEILIEAQEALTQKQRQQAEMQTRETIRRFSNDLFNDGQSYAINPQGQVTLVEFFDYQCVYCKQVHPALKRLRADDSDLRIVKKEFPILGPMSLLAARTAMAALRQDGQKYERLHDAMMESRAPLTEAAINQMAVAADLNLEQLIKDREDPAIDAALRANHELAVRLGINGTPAFVIGERLIPGAVSLDGLKQAVAETRAKK